MKNVQMALRAPNPEDFVDQAGAVKLTGLSRTALHRMAADGRLKPYRIGSHRVYWRDDVLALAQARKLLRGDERGLPCCGHAYARHHDLAGCAVDGCDCDQSKATLK